MSGNVATTLALEVLVLDPSLQCRASVDRAVVAEYAELLRSGATFPPVAVVLADGRHLVTDGWHRVHAHRLAERTEIAAMVEAGTRREAMLQAVRANSAHGLQRSQADKRRAVQLLLMDPEWSRLTGREIASLAGVSHTFVDQARGRYRIKRGEVLTEARACEVDGEPPAPWRTLLAQAPDWSREKIEKVRTATSPEHLVGLPLYVEAERQALSMRKQELAVGPWPWPEDETEEARAARCARLDTVEDLRAALTSAECPSVEPLYEVLHVSGQIAQASESWTFDRIRRELEGRPALLARLDARVSAVKAKQKAQPTSVYEQAREIYELDFVHQVKAVRECSDQVLAQLWPEKLHTRVRDGVYKARLAPDGAVDCIVPGCLGWVRPLTHGGQCAWCNTFQEQWKGQTAQALLRTADLLTASPDWSVAAGEVVLSQKALACLRWLTTWDQRVRRDEMPDELLDLVDEWQRDQPSWRAVPKVEEKQAEGRDEEEGEAEEKDPDLDDESGDDETEAA